VRDEVPFMTKAYRERTPLSFRTPYAHVREVGAMRPVGA
jgi:hypothetical protein